MWQGMSSLHREHACPEVVPKPQVLPLPAAPRVAKNSHLLCPCAPRPRSAATLSPRLRRARHMRRGGPSWAACPTRGWAPWTARSSAPRVGAQLPASSSASALSLWDAPARAHTHSPSCQPCLRRLHAGCSCCPRFAGPHPWPALPARPCRWQRRARLPRLLWAHRAGQAHVPRALPEDSGQDAALRVVPQLQAHGAAGEG